MTTLPEPRDADRYLRLSQFLDLHARWTGSADRRELAHRIRQTTSLLLATDDVEVVVVDDSRAFPDPIPVSPSHPQRDAGMVARALKTALPQLHGEDTRAVGVFPFRVSSGVRGYLRVSLPRPLFEGIEVAFLRFVASLAGVLLSVTSNSPAGDTALPSPQPAPSNNSAARRYVAMAVHDLRNPLNVISGYGGLLADGTLGTLSGEQQEAVEAINRQLGSLLGLIDRLVDFERLARAETTLSISRFVVRELFEEVRERCFGTPTRMIDWPGAEANFDFATDRRRLYAIVQNLVDNAIKHTEQGSILVTCSRRDGRLLITVADTGSGLPAGLAAALTDRNACERLQERGLGIGLYTVARYVGALGGRLSIRSPNDAGTEIEVDLPALVPPSDPGVVADA